MAAAAPPQRSADELEALIREARERQLRRRLVGAAGVAIAAATGLAVYALATNGHHRTTTAGAPALQTPVCRAPWLSATFGTGGAAGLALGGLVLGNTADRSCSVPAGRPIVHVIFRGRSIAGRETSWASSEHFGRPASHILRPGRKAFYEIGWRGWCPDPAAAPQGRRATLTVLFRNGLRLTVADTALDRGVSLPGCGEAVHPAPWIAVSPLLRYR